MMTGITWLHLSDWHQREADFDREVVRDALIRDIRARERINPALAHVDFIVFSGDLAFSGKPAEYETAGRELLDPALNAVGLEPNRLFIVPGNHDLDREIVYEMLPMELQKPLNTDALVQKWLIDKRRRERMLEPFDAYREFVSRYTGQPTPDFASILRLNVDGKHVALLGINSAWMCARHLDDEGKVNDYGYTLLGEPQIRDALAQIADADVRIAVLHHPFDWLAPFDRNHVEALLGHGCHFILRGHEHQPKVNVMRGTGGDCVIIPAGASYKRRIAKDPRYTNAYNWVHLDFETGQGGVYLRRWSDPRNEWIEDTDAHPGGKYTFSGAPDERRLARVEARYRELLLETCDIISLVGLPEQDCHIAERQLALRRLYIPLHAWVEVQTGEAPDDPEKETAQWEAPERIRAAARRGLQDRDKDERKRERVPVGERLTQSHRLVILGDPGAGKTTLTRWIATAYLLRLKADPEWRNLPAVQTLPDAVYLPIIIRCRDLDTTCVNGTLDDILHHTLRKAELSDAEAADLVTLLRTRLEAGTALLMLDGLDEITDAQARACFCEQVERIAVAYKAPIIVTSRIVGYREMGRRLGRDFEHLTLADLTPEEKDDFVRRWCDLTELPERRETATEELIRDLHSAERIERLTGNPMLLTTMALVKRKVGKLPNRRADLYGEAVQVLLNWRREVDEPLDSREAIPQLEYLAYAMSDRGVQQLRKDEVLALLARMREDYPHIYAVRARLPGEFLQRLEARTGILIEAGRVRHLGMDKPVYEFRHLTFQEYLAARALVDGRFPGRDATKSLAKHVAPLAGRTAEMPVSEVGLREIAVVEAWRETLRLCLAICSDDDVDPALRAILTPLPDEPPATVRARAVQAALCLADEPNASDAAAEEILRTFAAQVGEDDGGGNVRTNVDRAAMELVTTRWEPSLRAALLDEFCRREAAVRFDPGGLAGMVAGAAAPQEKAAMAAWLGEQARRLREGDEAEAMDAALGVMLVAFKGQAQAVPGLSEALLARLVGGSVPMAHAAAWALGWLNRGGSSRSDKTLWQPTLAETDVLLAFLQNPGSDPYAVRYLTRIISRERIERAVEPLLFWLENPIARVRSAAAEALGRIGDASAVAPLIARLEDDDARVRRAAAKALRKIEDTSAVAPLIALLEHDNTRVRYKMAEALGKIKDGAVVSPLIARLEDDDAGVRRAAATALGRIGDAAAVAPLIALLEDDDANVRHAAGNALGKIGDAAAVAPLIARLEDDDAGVRRAAAEALGGIGDAAAVAPLIARLEDDDRNVRRAAAEALGSIGNEAAVAPLIARLEDDDAGVRSAAATALGQIGDAAAVTPLIARLEDDDAGVRSAAAEALGGIGDAAAVAPLIARLEDDDAGMRRAAAYALGQIGDAAAVTPLIARLEDDDEDVRSAAAAALGQIGDAAAVAPLIARLEDDDAGVRSAAAYALGRIGDAAAVAPLIARLEDDGAGVRSAAAYALGRIGDAAAVAPLIARLEDDDANVCSAAATALDTVFYSQGRYQEVEAIWRRVIARDEKIAFLWTRLGGYYQQTGRLAEALEAHEQAVVLEPKRAVHRTSLAGVLRQLGRNEEVAEHLARARATPLHKEDDYNKACFEAIAGNVETALAHLTHALKKGSDRAWAARDPDLIWLHGNPRFEALVAIAKPEQSK